MGSEEKHKTKKEIEDSVPMSSTCSKLFQSWKGLCKTHLGYVSESILNEDETIQLEFFRAIINIYCLFRKNHDYDLKFEKLENVIFLNNCLLHVKKGSLFERAIMKMSPDDIHRLSQRFFITKFLEEGYDKLFEDFIKERGEENINNHYLKTPLDERTILLIINFWRSHEFSKIEEKFYEPIVNITSDILEYIGRLEPFNNNNNNNSEEEEEDDDDEEEEEKEEKKKKKEGKEEKEEKEEEEEEEENIKIEEKWKNQKSLLFYDLFSSANYYVYNLIREEQREVEDKGEEFNKPTNKICYDYRIINVVKKVLKNHIKRIYEITISNNLNIINKYINIYPHYHYIRESGSPPLSLPIPPFSSYMNSYPFSFDVLIAIVDKDSDVEGLWREDEKERVEDKRITICVGLSSVWMELIRTLDKMKVRREEVKKEEVKKEEEKKEEEKKEEEKKEEEKPMQNQNKRIPNTFSSIKEKRDILYYAGTCMWNIDLETNFYLFKQNFIEFPDFFKNFIKNYIAFSFLHDYYSIDIAYYKYYCFCDERYLPSASSLSSSSSSLSSSLSSYSSVYHPRPTPPCLLFQSHRTSLFLSYYSRRECGMELIRMATNINSTDQTYIVDWFVKREEEGGCDFVKLLMEVGCRERVRVRRDFDIRGGKGWGDKVKEGEKVEWDEGGVLEKADSSIYTFILGINSLYSCIRGYDRYNNDKNEKLNKLWFKRGEEGKKALENMEDILEEEDVPQCIIMYLTYNDVYTSEEFDKLYINDPQRVVQESAMEGMADMLCPLNKYSPLRDVREMKKREEEKKKKGKKEERECQD